MTVPTSTARLSCLCGAVREPGTLLQASTLPIDPPEICHCNPCRYTTGSLGASFPVLRTAPSPTSLAACTAYDSSATHTRYFCTTCGTPTFIDVKVQGYWGCLAGIVERDPEQVKEGEVWSKDVVTVSRHDFVGDTGDGGLAARLLVLGGRDVPCYKEGQRHGDERLSGDEVRAMQRAAEEGGQVAGEGEVVAARCHCGGVDLRIQRADFREDAQGVGERFTEAKDRYLAQFCACRSCRLQSGVSLQPWAYIPPANFRTASGEPVVFGREAQGMNGETTLTHYWSSGGCCRSFCGRCGASWFYWCEDRPEVVDLSVGVLRSEDGCMARRWLGWKWKVSWREEAADEELTRAVVGE